MIARHNRFHGHGSLKYLYKNGRPARSRSFLVKSVNNPMRVHSRLVVVVSKKVIKSAVGRNRIRRRVYEIMRRSLPLIPPHTDIAVTVYSPDVRLVAARELEAELTGLLRSAKLYQTGAKTGTLD